MKLRNLREKFRAGRLIFIENGVIIQLQRNFRKRRRFTLAAVPCGAYFVALMTLLLQPPECAPFAIVLDEPEIGLHPFALSELAAEVRTASKTSQMIISTQSPLLLNHFDCEDVITADYDTVLQRSVLRRHTKSELTEWLKDYSLGELWEKNVLGGLPL